MADQSASAHLQSLFESALQDYGVKTGVSLTQHPLAVDLQKCQSVDDTTTLLQSQVHTFGNFQERDRMMTAIKIVVSILAPLSGAGFLANVVGVVCQKVLMTCPSLTLFFSDIAPTCECNTSQSWNITECMCHALVHGRYHCESQVNQTSNGVISNCHVLANLLESIQQFVDRLKVYTEISPTPSINKILVGLIVDLISTLALVTRKIRQRRSREFILTDLLPHSARSSHSRKEFFCCQGRQAGPATSGPTHARRVSE
jgi:hypothetical protein